MAAGEEKHHKNGSKAKAKKLYCPPRAKKISQDRINKRRYNVVDALDLVTGSDSELSELSDDDGDDEDVLPANESQAEEADLDAEDNDDPAAAPCAAKKSAHILLEKM
eukprot:gene5642-10869_t